MNNEGKTNSADYVQSKEMEISAICSQCDFNGNNTELKEHVESSHGRKYNCELCGNSFESEERLKDHSNADHVKTSSIEPFPCEKCGLVVANFPLLQAYTADYDVNSRNPKKKQV